MARKPLFLTYEQKLYIYELLCNKTQRKWTAEVLRELFLEYPELMHESHQNLANVIGVNREVVSRIINPIRAEVCKKLEIKEDL